MFQNWKRKLRTFAAKCCERDPSTAAMHGDFEQGSGTMAAAYGPSANSSASAGTPPQGNSKQVCTKRVGPLFAGQSSLDKLNTG